MQEMIEVSSPTAYIRIWACVGALLAVEVHLSGPSVLHIPTMVVMVATVHARSASTYDHTHSRCGGII